MIRKSGHRFSLATNAKGVCAEIMRKQESGARPVALLELYDMLYRAAEGNLVVTASACPDRETLTVPSQGCGMEKKKGTHAPELLEEDADG
jgi:hypothetical protein